MIDDDKSISIILDSYILILIYYIFLSYMGSICLNIPMNESTEIQ